MPNAAATRELLERNLLARVPFIYVRTAERARAETILTAIAQERQLDIVEHTLSRGLRELRTNTVVSDDKSLWGALDFAAQQFQARQNLTVVFTDVQGQSDDNEVTRRLLDLATLGEQRGGALVVVSADPVWTELQRQGMAIALDVPDIDEMRAEIKDFLDQYRAQILVEWQDAELDEAASMLQGVRRLEALNILSTIVVKGAVTKDDLALLSSAKDGIFSDLSGIERVTVNAREAEVGGLAGLREWLERKRPLLTMDLRDRGLRPPRGVLLVGVPGCGKSLSAKAVAGSWRLPLYRLDMASIFGQYVGQSENRFKEALATADTVAPCVLWIDEIEKGLAGSGSDSTGVTTRLVGQFLYWLQESSSRVFVVATANDVRTLPQELLRAGRFDDLFFVDLPDADERREIIRIYCRRQLKRPVDEVLVDKLVGMSEGFSGADIASAVGEVTAEAIRVGDDQVQDDYFVSAFANVVPLSRSSPERIEEVRQMRDRAIPASGKSVVAQAGAQTPGRRVVLG